MPAHWTFQLCDAAGGSIAELSTASGRSLRFKRNDAAESSFTISHRDETATDLLGALSNTGVPVLRCYRRAEGANAGVVRFRGELVEVVEDVEESGLLTATFRSPFGQLLGNGDDTGRFVTSTLAPYVATDAGVIALDLIERANADSPTGLSTSRERQNLAYTPPGPPPIPQVMFGYTKPRDRTYPVGTNMGQAIVNLTNVLDGFDFTESFVDGTGTTHAEFVISASLGGDAAGARFEYGETTLANVRRVERTTVPPANCVFITGGNGGDAPLTATYQDAASVAKYGRRWMTAEYSDVVEQAILDDKARALVRPNPVRTITFTPDAALAPRPWDDYDLGDRVRFFARQDAFAEDVALRLNSFEVLVDDNGYETHELPDPTSPDADLRIRATLSAEVVE